MTGLFLRLLTITLLGIWLVLLLFGKSGFIHILILSALGVGSIEAARVIRHRQRQQA